ncbi:TonB-dependent receptor domain-containing protein [Phenylobacterium montanum]|uniref:TonB-dependent receptor n=1 Tax=Phenylobacterium montanum TaxID=2823693 RepID=A0A975IWH0_9CAUL|nr:TonB-dependent receptor [Caulobacter sp. S6]QUD89579.1 TonB-dependent receptor [Caulobacter sp. S6]
MAKYNSGKASGVRRLLLGGAAMAAGSLWSAVAIAGATHEFNIPPESAAEALKAFAAQTGLQLIFPYDAAAQAKSPGVHGRLSDADAIKTLLSGTGLEIVQINDTTAVVRFQSAAGANTAQGDAAPSQISEIVVTANKRPELLRSISASISAVTAGELETLGAESFSDYLNRVPGVSFNAGAEGYSTATIRGVSTTTENDQGQGTTGYFINDVPLTDPYFSAGTPDIDAFDVDNVTVLRGPQGTLYGSGSLGGVINYQTMKPDLRRYDVHVQSTFEGTQHGSGGGSGKVMVNLPLVEDVLAVRGVFVYRQEPGFIANIGTGQRNVNNTLTRGGRLEATWRPNARTTVNYLYLLQTQDTPDQGYQEPDIAGPYKKNTPTAEPANFTTEIHNIRVDEDLSFATLTLSAAYHRKKELFSQDLTSDIAPIFNGVLSPVPSPSYAGSDGSTFEVRLTSKPGSRIDYLVGLYHDDTRERNFEALDAPNAAANIDSLYGSVYGSTIGQQITSGDQFENDGFIFHGQESALFGEASYHLNDEWKFTFGGRLYDEKSTNRNINQGLFELIASDPANIVTESETSVSSEYSGFTPKGSITWTPSNSFMAYGLVSEGFRFGGGNPTAFGANIPLKFRPDSLMNYEFGSRLTLLNRTLLIDTTLFYINWSNIQVRLDTSTGLGYAANAGRATNYGVEEAVTWRPVRGFALQSNLTYLDATLETPLELPSGLAPKGATLPGASKWTISNTLSYRWEDAPLRPALVLSERYVSRAPGIFGQPGTQQGEYNLVDIRASARVRGIEVTAFVENIGDSHGVATAFNYGQLSQYLVRPRTFGLTFDYKL